MLYAIYTSMFVLFKTIISKPMISHFLYHPAQVSWSDGLVPLFRFSAWPRRARAMIFLFVYYNL